MAKETASTGGRNPAPTQPPIQINHHSNQNAERGRLVGSGFRIDAKHITTTPGEAGQQREEAFTRPRRRTGRGRDSVSNAVRRAIDPVLPRFLQVIEPPRFANGPHIRVCAYLCTHACMCYAWRKNAPPKAERCMFCAQKNAPRDNVNRHDQAD